MLGQRLVFGTLLIAFLIGVFWLDDRVGQVAVGGQTLPAGLFVACVFIGLAAVASRELCAIFRAKGVSVSTPIVAAGVVGLAVMMYLVTLPWVAWRIGPMVGSWMALVMLVAFIKHSVPKQQTQGAAQSAAATMFALVYLGLLPAFYLLIRHTHSAWVVAATILVVKQCDTGAYFTGRAIGKTKLIPWLSPGKTWEGLAGGLVLSAVTAVLFAMWANHLGLFKAGDLPLWYAGVTGAVIGGIGHIGDLVASLLKRDAGIKDSGKLIPGMGGALDVLDSPLVAAPVAYWMLSCAPT